jgi:hypothetical protein
METAGPKQDVSMARRFQTSLARHGYPNHFGLALECETLRRNIAKRLLEMETNLLGLLAFIL